MMQLGGLRPQFIICRICHFQVVILPVSAVTASVATVICYHQLNGRTSTLIYVLSLDVPMATLACCLCRHDVTGNSCYMS